MNDFLPEIEEIETVISPSDLCQSCGNPLTFHYEKHENGYLEEVAECPSCGNTETI